MIDKLPYQIFLKLHTKTEKLPNGRPDIKAISELWKKYKDGKYKPEIPKGFDTSFTPGKRRSKKEIVKNKSIPKKEIIEEKPKEESKIDRKEITDQAKKYTAQQLIDKLKEEEKMFGRKKIQKQNITEQKQKKVEELSSIKISNVKLSFRMTTRGEQDNIIAKLFPQLFSDKRIEELKIDIEPVNDDEENTNYY